MLFDFAVVRFDYRVIPLSRSVDRIFIEFRMESVYLYLLVKLLVIL
jgi:hypothetical protein